MTALLIIYALGVLGVLGLTYSYSPDETRKKKVRVLLMSLIWPVTLTLSVGQLLGQWARR